MSAQQSCLYDYGFDVVVASTQQALNATVKQYIREFGRGASPVITAYFVMDDNGNVAQVPFSYPNNKQFAMGCFGFDPITVPTWNGTGAKPEQVSKLEVNLYNNVDGVIFPTMPAISKFCYAVSFQLGFPGNNIPGTDIITLSDDGQYVTYKLCFQNLTLVGANYPSNMNLFPMYSFDNLVQKATTPYEFTVKVPLKQINADESNLPADVAARAAALGDAFTLQQLVLDMDNATWYDGLPTITNVASTSVLYTMLQNDFLPAFAQMIAEYGKTTLGYNFISNEQISENFAVTDVTLQIDNSAQANPAPAAATLDYLCAVNNNPPRTRVDFSAPKGDGFHSWNWFDTKPTVHGVMAINPISLASYYSKMLLPYVQSNCYIPGTTWITNKQKTHYICDTPTMQPGQTPTIAIYDTSGPLLTFSYSSLPSQGSSSITTLDENDQQVTYTQELSTSFTLTLDAGINNTLVVTQRLVMFYHVTTDTLNTSGNIVDKTITDTYTLDVDNQGKYAPSVGSATTDNSQNIDSKGIDNLFSGGFNSVLDQVQEWAQTLAAKNVTDIPVNDIQGLVFPGGNAFSLNNLFFSDNKDLVGYITYATPAYITN